MFSSGSEAAARSYLQAAAARDLELEQQAAGAAIVPQSLTAAATAAGRLSSHPIYPSNNHTQSHNTSPNHINHNAYHPNLLSEDAYDLIHPSAAAVAAYPNDVASLYGRNAARFLMPSVEGFMAASVGTAASLISSHGAGGATSSVPDRVGGSRSSSSPGIRSSANLNHNNPHSFVWDPLREHSRTHPAAANPFAVSSHQAYDSHSAALYGNRAAAAAHLASTRDYYNFAALASYARNSLRGNAVEDPLPLHYDLQYPSFVQEVHTCKKRKHEAIDANVPIEERRVKGTVAMCCICFENEVSHVLYPCGHPCLCSDCASMGLRECPVCRAKNIRPMKFYGTLIEDVEEEKSKKVSLDKEKTL